MEQLALVLNNQNPHLRHPAYHKATTIRHNASLIPLAASHHRTHQYQSHRFCKTNPFSFSVPTTQNTRPHLSPPSQPQRSPSLSSNSSIPPLPQRAHNITSPHTSRPLAHTPYTSPKKHYISSISADSHSLRTKLARLGDRRRIVLV